MHVHVFSKLVSRNACLLVHVMLKIIFLLIIFQKDVNENQMRRTFASNSKRGPPSATNSGTAVGDPFPCLKYRKNVRKSICNH